MDELYYGRLSEEYVETVEPVTAYAIAIGDLLRIMESDLDMANWGRVIHLKKVIPYNGKSGHSAETVKQFISRLNPRGGIVRCSHNPENPGMSPGPSVGHRFISWRDPVDFKPHKVLPQLRF